MEEASSQVGWRPECRADRDALGAGAAGARGKRQEQIRGQRGRCTRREESGGELPEEEGSCGQACGSGHQATLAGEGREDRWGSRGR